jgi:DNA (cytosine-5)-methyltransferase 1
VSAFTVGSLFAGIGGIDLGFERAGFITKWQVEIDPYCRKVLAKNFPHAERFEDVRNCGIANLSPVDVIVGGFPCQDISHAGRCAGIAEGTRSGLWFEYARIISELRPQYVFVENVSALLGRGMGIVVGQLSEMGYDCEWGTFTAHRSVGAPHLRERVYIVAHARRFNGKERMAQAGGRGESKEGAQKVRCIPGFIFELGTSLTSRIQAWLSCESGMARMAHGIPNRVDRASALGNAVVPQIPELFAHRIRKSLEEA